ncbi:MAG: hypothetical protein QY307_09455 [Acidimicrobiia bacterium]|nr:MAG: hypothetical protein QY307_09455 [Acidimicrobiia bacterium]
MSADPALALAVAYLRLNGYFLLTEQELHIRESAGYRTLTDIDILALRPPTAPGPDHHRLGQGVEECLIVTDVDTGLDVDTSRFDVIVGEVKTAEAELNPALRTPGALHAALRRTGDLYTTPLDQVVDQLIAEGSSTTPTARVRLVVFAGHGHETRALTIHLGDTALFIRSHLHAHHDLYRVTQFSDPVVALLELLEKIH